METISHCNIHLVFWFTNRVDKDSVDNKKVVEDDSVDERKSSDASKDIKKETQRYEEKIRSGEAPVGGDSTGSEE